MPMSRRRSLVGLLLTFLFVGGNFGLPVADAVLFHSTPGAAAPPKASLGNPGGEAGHQQICLQLKATGQVRSIPGSGTPTAPLPPEAVSRPVPPPPLLTTSPDPSRQFSRAPPSVTARG